MLARRLIAGRPRFQREPELVPVLSYLANQNYIPPLPDPGAVNTWDGFVNISPDGAPLFAGRATIQQFGILGAEAPPASHLQKTITLLDVHVGISLFRCGPGGIDPVPLEILPYSAGPNWCRHLGATVLMRPISPSFPNILVESGRLGITNRRTNAFAEFGTENPSGASGSAARAARWINNGDIFVSLSNMGTVASDTAASSIAYADHGFTRTSSGLLQIAERDWIGPDRTVVRELGVSTTDVVDLRHETFASDDVVLTASCQINTGLAASVVASGVRMLTPNGALRQGRHYSMASVVVVEARRTPFGAPVESGGFTNLPTTLKLRATRRTGLLVVLPAGAVEFHPMRVERYAADIAAWQRTVSGVTGFVSAGSSAWPLLATNFPVATTVDQTLPTVARPMVMSDRLIEIVGSQIRMWGFDGSYLGANAIPAGVTVSRLPKSDLLWNRSTRWRTLDFGATWAQFDAGHADLFDGAYTSVQLY